MATTIATVTPEGLALPADFMAELNLQPGTQITVTIGDRLYDLFGVTRSAPALRQSPSTVISNLQNMFAGEPSLEDEYFRNRDKDKW